jgi:transposase
MHNIDTKFLLEIIILQQKKISELTEKLSTNSQNSSKPPSLDFKLFKNKKNAAKKKSNNKRGAQLGHKGINRKLENPNNVNKIIDCNVDLACICGANLNHEPNNYSRHQIYDLCDVSKQLILTEYRLYKTVCKRCNQKHKGTLPDELDNSIIGSSLKTLIGTMVCEFHLSKSKVVRFLELQYGLKICQGTVSNTEFRISAALEKSYNELTVELQKQDIVHADETRHTENNKTNWLWVGTNDKLTVFKFDKSRGKKAARLLLGINFNGILISDRYAAYNIIDIEQRQLCWAHLKRDFIRISQRSGIPGRIGEELLFYQQRLFNIWHRYKNNKISFSIISKAVAPIQKNIERCLEKAINYSHKQTANTCKNLLKSFSALWTFTENEGVEPTNNHAERQIRPYVIYRKLSFGTQSTRGTKYLERIMSIITTCKQQLTDSFKYIKESIINYNKNIGPSLLFHG